MTLTNKENIEFYKNIYFNDIDFDIYKVKNKSNIKYFNNNDILYSSPFGSYIILKSDKNKFVSLLDLNKYIFNNYGLY